MTPERSCEAPEHVRNCSGVGNTKDHFTPKSIGRVLGWTAQQINAPENIQWLSQQCHRDKDGSTPDRLQQVRAQLAGQSIGFGEHITVWETKQQRRERRRVKKHNFYEGR